ncbi:hypothetical protein HYW31_01505, partial [Candidatus Berkelbacteria bacterium]|nr:hypothetical protein [Candidatus Berkelbacteria bacterium]
EKEKKEKIDVKPRRDLITAPHFVFWIKELLAEKYGEKMVDEGGLRVTTTWDLDIQRKAEEAVEAGSKKLDQYNANNAALVALDPKRGQVVAMVGSKDYFNLDIDGNVNVTLSARQPGSAFKPIVYATAFKQKYNPAFTLFDLPTDFGGGYSPNNYDGNFRGPLTMRAALSNSLNIPAVKTLALVGVKNAIKTAEDLGITTLTDPNRYGLALVLGGGEVKPIELTNAFSAFVASGKVSPINPILKIEDRKGKVLEEYPDDKIKASQALDAQAAYQIYNVLSDSEARKMIFGFTNALNIAGHKAAVKTGTTQEYRDAWTVGGTPALVTGVWVGNTRNENMKKGADGSVLAAPIWNRFMTETMRTWGAEYPERPAGLAEIEVDKLSNKLPTEHSPEIIKDLFASWQVPKEKDNIHIKIKVNKLNGKLATNDTPSELIEERLYTNIHSELPNSPGWENTVLEWARGTGINNFPPTEKDDSYTSQNKPNINISAPKENGNVQGVMEIKAEASAGYGIDNVEFYLDNNKIGEKKEPPFVLSFDFSGQSVGAHKLKAKVIDKNGGSGWHEINVSVPADSNPPVISNISYFAAGSTAAFHWTTNEPADSQVEYGLTPALGAFSILTPTPLTAHVVELGGLQVKTPYFFRARSKDAAGNLGLSGIYSLTTQ